MSWTDEVPLLAGTLATSLQVDLNRSRRLSTWWAKGRGRHLYFSGLRFTTVGYGDV